MTDLEKAMPITNKSTMRASYPHLFVCGSRVPEAITFDGHPAIFSRRTVEQAIFRHLMRLQVDPSTVVIVGDARSGGDAAARLWAKTARLAMIVFAPAWAHHGRRAGPIRNQWMVDMLPADRTRAIAFWDGESRGTDNAIRLLQARNIEPELVSLQQLMVGS